MSYRKPKATPEQPSELVVALTTFSAEVAVKGTRTLPVVAHQGRTFRRSDPIVRAAPHYFAPEGLSDGELAAAAEALKARKAAANAGHRAQAIAADGRAGRAARGFKAIPGKAAGALAGMLPPE